MVGRASRHYGDGAGSLNGCPGELLMNSPYSYLQGASAPLCLRLRCIMKKTLSSLSLKHEAFVLALLSGMTAADAARKAGYGRKNINVRIIAWELLQREDIQKRLTEVMEATTDDGVLSLLQRKQVLSQIARASLKDYQDENGHFRPLDDDTPNPSAIAEVIYKYDPVKRQAYPSMVRLRDPVDAIIELCRLDGAYKKKPMAIQIAPITSVTVDQTRAKLHAMLERLEKRCDSER